MKNYIITLTATLAFACTAFAQTGGPPPPPVTCPPENSLTQLIFQNINDHSEGCDYEVQILLTGTKPAYFTQCPIHFQAGHFPLVLHQFNLPASQMRIRDVYSFSHPINAWYEVTLVINNTSSGITTYLPLPTFYEDLNGQPQGNTVISPSVCGPPKINTFISSTGGHDFVIFDQ